MSTFQFRHTTEFHDAIKMRRPDAVCAGDPQHVVFSCATQGVDGGVAVLAMTAADLREIAAAMLRAADELEGT